MYRRIHCNFIHVTMEVYDTINLNYCRRAVDEDIFINVPLKFIIVTSVSNRIRHFSQNREKYYIYEKLYFIQGISRMTRHIEKASFCRKHSSKFNSSYTVVKRLPNGVSLNLNFEQLKLPLLEGLKKFPTQNHST